MMKRLYLLTYILFAVVCFYGCKGKKDISASPEILDMQKRYDAYQENVYPYKTFQSKIDVTFKNGSKSVSSKGTLKLIRDEKLQIVITPFLGIEVARLEVSNDSVLLIDRIKRRYLKASIGQYRDRLPLDLGMSTLSALLMNNIFVPGRTATFERFDWVMESSGNMLGRMKKSGNIALDFELDASGFLKRTTAASAGHNLSWAYSDFQVIGTKNFPCSSLLQYISEQNKNKFSGTTIQIDYLKPEFDKTLNISTNVPSSYSKVELEEIIRMLM